MIIDFLQEPELQFGVDRHIDIRFGLTNYGPVDYQHPLAPKAIKVGIVGTNETVQGVREWLEKCRIEVAAKDSRQPNLFPKFPGFRLDTAFRSTLIMDDRLQRVIPVRSFKELAGKKDPDRMVRESVELFHQELTYLTTNTNADVLICAVPQILLNVTGGSDDQSVELGEETGNPAQNQPDFHDLLKAKALDLQIPIQLIVPSTYDVTKMRFKKRCQGLVRRPQDEATRAWNFHTALYYKAKGIPWRMIREPAQYTTCFVGISFYITLDGSLLLASVAQIFNERGEGVVVRGGKAKIAKEDRQVHFDEQDAELLLANALAMYRDEHKNLPARVVLHKTSAFNDSEMAGFTAAAHAHGVEMLDLVSVDIAYTRLFRAGAYPPLRGTFLSLNEQNHILYTRGSVDFFATYPGMYVPRPLRLRCDRTEQTPKFLAQEVLALTKMNWNNTQFDGCDPITLRAARQAAAILKYVPPEATIAPTYRFYM